MGIKDHGRTVSKIQLKAGLYFIVHTDGRYYRQRADKNGNFCAIVLGHDKGTRSLMRTKRQLKNRNGKVGYGLTWYIVKGFDSVTMEECLSKYEDIYLKRDK